MAQRFETLRFFSLHDFVVYLRRLIDEEPYEPQAQILGESENVVRLMTVHQAKGLEFPIVILADAGRGPGYDNTTPLLDSAHGLIMCETVGSGSDEIPNAALKRCRARVREEEDAEAVRLLYVAMTRARDRLIISEGANTEGWSTQLRAFIGDQHFSGFGRERLEINSDGIAITFRCAETGAAEMSDDAGGQPTLEPALLAAIRKRLSAQPTDRGDITISPTALADFDRCPRQYWLRHGLGLPEPRRNGSASGDAATMGSVAHQVLERLRFGSCRASSVAEVRRLTTALGAARLSAEDCAIIARDLTRYLETVSDGEQILGRELPFMLNPAPGLFVRGQIDLLAGDAAGLTVRDYKYSRRADADHYATQLECYVLAVAIASLGVAITAEVVALRDGPETVTLTLPGSDQIRTRLAALGSALHKAAATGEYLKKPQNIAACRGLGCGYVERCWTD
jgi:ATP-dependent helicase/nuclease subunit A